MAQEPDASELDLPGLFELPDSSDIKLIQAESPAIEATVPPAPAPARRDEEGVLMDGIPDPFADDPLLGKGKGGEKKWYEKLNIRGYAQFRFNEVTNQESDSAPPSYAGDNSVDDERNFIIRRARVIISGDVHDRVFVYLQTDFASGVPGSPDADMYAQIRDWYADFYITEDQVHRIRAGQSKVPYGWENMQSSSNRIQLDRNDGLNSAVRNERDLGLFYYYTPEWVQNVFEQVIDENLKGSGNYGMVGLGIYNGQGGSLRDRNDGFHVVGRITYPVIFNNGQIWELGLQGYTGDYVVLGAPIEPNGVGPPIIPAGTDNHHGQTDQRLAGSFIMYPQPLGFQAEWNVGRGPALNKAQTAVQVQSLYGGYAMLFYKYDSQRVGTFFPFLRYTHFKGGYKAFRNAPYSDMRDWELGCEWQFNKVVELTGSYLFANRTNLNAVSAGESYLPFIGQVLRFQLQVNY
ncbi:porin [Planctomicrobium sp. SH661]|uniref:porin n=1 Tax=Planctomicrobium sp. SH661 TaxID=3448124 RepID=UPI003F5B7FA0